jgi:hypothetical protein
MRIVVLVSSYSVHADGITCLCGRLKIALFSSIEALTAMDCGHVKFENSRHHDDSLRLVAVFEHRKFQSFGAIDEDPAPKAALITDNPMPMAVPADKVVLGTRRFRRGRFTVVHDTSPFDSMMYHCGCFRSSSRPSNRPRK